MIVALALVVAAFYSGAALYVNLVEKPALLALDDKSALAGWKIALKRGAVIQAPLCAIGFALGLIAWLHLRDIDAGRRTSREESPPQRTRSTRRVRRNRQRSEAVVQFQSGRRWTAASSAIDRSSA